MQVFRDRASASAVAAKLITERLASRLDRQERASLMVSGGSTPATCLQILSKVNLPWSRVDITLTDEREVPSNHPDSNEKMVREKLLIANAGAGNFVRLEGENTRRLHPFACTLVGMGDDGHFASLFPDAPQLTKGLHSQAETIRVTTPSSPYERVSATLATIRESDLIILLIFGDTKRQIAEAPTGYPIDHLLSGEVSKVTTIWAP